MLTPYNNMEDQQDFLRDGMEALQTSAPFKRGVAESLYGCMSLSCGSEKSTNQDPLISQCFGNRSAVIFELGKYEVSSYM